MKMSTKTRTASADLSRPAVEVKIEAVHIGIAELAYLRALTQPKGLRCTPSQKTLDKLRFLDLIARAKVQPPEEAWTEFKSRRDGTIAKLKDAVKSEQWSVVYDCAYELKHRLVTPAACEDDVLTEKGKQLLAQGNATVRVRKVGCVE
jgi:hypothetical protein